MSLRTEEDRRQRDGRVNGRSLRVLIADDHEPTREDIRQVVEADPTLEVCGAAADAVGAVSLALRRHPDICLLDVNMPGSGLAAAWEIASRLPETKIVMLTVSDDDADLREALRSGACGYLLKDMDPTRIPNALRDVYDGESAIPRRMTAKLLEDFRGTEPRRRNLVGDGALPGHLTSREWEVLEMLADGLSTNKVAERLFVSSTAVRVHVSSLVKKLGVRDRAEAAELFRARRDA